MSYRRLRHYKLYIDDILNYNPDKSLSDKNEDLLRKMFYQIQIPFKKHCPPQRSTFLPYNYVLYQFLTLLDLKDLRKKIVLVKSNKTLEKLDEIWEKICFDLDWTFHPTTVTNDDDWYEDTALFPKSISTSSLSSSISSTSSSSPEFRKFGTIHDLSKSLTASEIHDYIDQLNDSQVMSEVHSHPPTFNSILQSHDNSGGDDNHNDDYDDLASYSSSSDDDNHNDDYDDLASYSSSSDDENNINSKNKSNNMNMDIEHETKNKKQESNDIQGLIITGTTVESPIQPIIIDSPEADPVTEETKKEEEIKEEKSREETIPSVNSHSSMVEIDLNTPGPTPFDTPNHTDDDMSVNSNSNNLEEHLLYDVEDSAPTKPENVNGTKNCWKQFIQFLKNL